MSCHVMASRTAVPSTSLAELEHTCCVHGCAALPRPMCPVLAPSGMRCIFTPGVWLIPSVVGKCACRVAAHSQMILAAAIPHVLAAMQLHEHSEPLLRMGVSFMGNLAVYDTRVSAVSALPSAVLRHALASMLCFAMLFYAMLCSVWKLVTEHPPSSHPLYA